MVEYNDKEISRASVAVIYYTNFSILILSLLLAYKIGIFEWERGKLGFREKYLNTFKSYDEVH